MVDVMTHYAQNSAAHRHDPIQAPVGEILRFHRNQCRLSLAQVEEALNIRENFLSAIEDGRFEDLPGRTYAIGFIKTYAQYLRLDEQELVDIFKSQDTHCTAHKKRAQIAPASNDNLPKLPLVIVSLLAFLAIAIFTGGNNNDADLKIDNAPVQPMASIDPFTIKNTSPFGNNALNHGVETLYY